MRYRYKVVWTSQTKERFSAFAYNKYRINYSKGSTVSGIQGTFGIMCFKTRGDAERWTEGRLFAGLQIIRVIPIGRGKVPKYICEQYGCENLDTFYRTCKSRNSKYFKGCTNPPQGTICYQSVKVVD